MFKRSPAKIRNFVFGVEDGLASTVGLLSGIAAAGLSAGYIILTGIVLIFVEAFSMAIGSILSENAAREYESGKDVPVVRSLAGGLIMFLSYIFAGLIPLAPYAFWPSPKALVSSIIFSIAALSLLGLFSARASQTSISGNVLKMIFLGGAAIIVGVVIGNLANRFYL